MSIFSDYLKSRNYSGRRKLAIFAEVMRRADLHVIPRFDGAEPHLFVSRGPDRTGVRIYEIGDRLAFRVQDLPDGEPHGRAFGIDVQRLFEEIIEEIDDKTPENAAWLLLGELGNAMKSFFADSIKAARKKPGEPGLKPEPRGASIL